MSNNTEKFQRGQVVKVVGGEYDGQAGIVVSAGVYLVDLLILEPGGAPHDDDTELATFYANELRPLVVLDLDEVLSHLTTPGERAIRSLVDVLRDSPSLSVQHVADQIEAQAKPARIPEPGVWGVVEAGSEGNRLHWVRTPGRWNVAVGSRSAEWHELADPVLIRGGVDD